MPGALLIAAAILSIALLAIGAVLWLSGTRETPAHDLGLALLSGGVIAAVVFVAQLGIDASVRGAERARAENEEQRSLRLTVGSSKSLEGIDLTNRDDLRGIYLGRKRLRYSRLAGADLSGTSLVFADLRETDLRDASLQGAQLRGARLDRAFLTGAALESADLTRASLRGARLGFASLEGARLGDASLQGATMIRAVGPRADMRESDLSGADARAATLPDADLRAATLDFADFGDADLRNVRLGPLRQLPGRQSEFEKLFDDLVVDPALGVSFQDADLRGASFGSLRVLGDFRGADLRGADLSEAVVSCPVEFELYSGCLTASVDPVDYRRLLASTSRHDESAAATTLSAVLLWAGHLIPAAFIDAALDKAPSMKKREAQRRLGSTWLLRTAFVPLTGLNLRDTPSGQVLESRFEGACIDDRTRLPAGIELAPVDGGGC